MFDNLRSVLEDKWQALLRQDRTFQQQSGKDTTKSPQTDLLGPGAGNAY